MKRWGISPTPQLPRRGSGGRNFAATGTLRNHHAIFIPLSAMLSDMPKKVVSTLIMTEISGSLGEISAPDIRQLSLVLVLARGRHWNVANAACTKSFTL